MKGEIDLITEELKTETSPIALVDFLTKLAGYGSYYEGLLEPILHIKPKAWLTIQKGGGWGDVQEVNPLPKPYSDKKTEMLWLTTNEGQRELEYSSLLKRIDRMSRAIKQNLWAKRIEFKNINPDI